MNSKPTGDISLPDRLNRPESLRQNSLYFRHCKSFVYLLQNCSTYLITKQFSFRYY